MLPAADCSAPWNRIKNEYAAEICAVLAFSAIKNSDRVGLVVATDQVEKVVVPKKGRKHVLRVIRELLFFEPGIEAPASGPVWNIACTCLTGKA